MLPQPVPTDEDGAPVFDSVDPSSASLRCGVSGAPLSLHDHQSHLPNGARLRFDVAPRSPAAAIATSSACDAVRRESGSLAKYRSHGRSQPLPLARALPTHQPPGQQAADARDRQLLPRRERHPPHVHARRQRRGEGRLGGGAADRDLLHDSMVQLVRPKRLLYIAIDGRAARQDEPAVAAAVPRRTRAPAGGGRAAGDGGGRGGEGGGRRPPTATPPPTPRRPTRRPTRRRGTRRPIRRRRPTRRRRRWRRRAAGSTRTASRPGRRSCRASLRRCGSSSATSCSPTSCGRGSVWCCRAPTCRARASTRSPRTSARSASCRGATACTGSTPT